MNDALLEIGCEELPVSYIEPALKQMEELAGKYLQERMLNFAGPPETAATPRRLVLYLKDVQDKTCQKIQRIQGPPERMLKDDNGEYTLAATGFSKKVGIPVEYLKVVEGKVCVEVKIGGEKAKKVLQEIFPLIIQNIHFPKTMIWEESAFRFARPIRHIAALLGSEVIRFAIAGIKSGKSTHGLYVLSSKKIEISTAKKYFEKLETLCIRVRQNDRKNYIATLIKNAVPATQGKVLLDEALLYENTFLVEMPSVVVGSFDKKYLELPHEILTTCLKVKQKFFSVSDKKHAIAPVFVGIRNGRSEFQSTVREGYERVLTARLEDAKFFYEQDKKASFESWIDKLKGVAFHEQLGSLFDKTERIQKIALVLCEHCGIGNEESLHIEEAARLSKADLVSSLVYEYPELQGTAGKLYARDVGKSDEVAQAIEDHYKPAGPDDSLPTGIVGSIIALADKIDSLVGYFLAGIVPSGNKDPFGLRRIAIGIIRIILHNEFHINIEYVIKSVIPFFSQKLQEKESPAVHDMLSFLRQRLENVFSSLGFAYDEINAVVDTVWRDACNVKDIADSLIRLKALHAIRSKPDFEALLAGYKRAENIIRQAKEKKISISSHLDMRVAMQQPEQTLNDTFFKIKKTYDEKQKLQKPLSQQDYESILTIMISLRKPLDDFFNTTMIMVEDEPLRANRLALLNEIVNLYRQIADFSQIVQK